jgi:hypothetical protein
VTRRSTLVHRAAAGSLSVLLLACDRGTSGSRSVAGGSTAATSRDSSAASAATAAGTTAAGARVARPDSVRALYVNGWAAGSRPRMAELIRIADSTEINALIVDVKESDTYLVYDSTAIPLAKEIGADTRPGTKWMPALLDSLQAHGIYSIARIVVFKDRMLAEKKPDLAIRHVNGGVWRDNKGGAWVNPYDKRVWDYNIAIAREALDMGFSEVQWDYVRFPDVTNRIRPTMSYPGSDGKSRPDNIRDFIAYSKQQLASYHVPVAADVFGLVTHLEGDVEIGQNWEKVITTADVVLPMVYPSHYFAGLYGMKRPQSMPYETVRLALTDAVERTKWMQDSAKAKTGEVMPWLEAMSIRGYSFGPNELRRQIQATYDAGLKSWALWNPGSKYAEYLDALRPANGAPSPLERSGWTPPQWEVPRAQLSDLIAKRTKPRADAATPSAPATPRSASDSARARSR